MKHIDKHFDMFTGYGGFTIAARDNGIETIGFSEIDKYAIQVYKYHFPQIKEYGDATRIVPEELPDFDLLTAGFPCQAFSIAGKRKGLEDTRGTLFYEIARIVSVKRPKLLLLENVRGLLSHDKGRTFGLILSTFSDLGYILQWQILNSKDFGVPQNRERVFIIGHLGKECFKQVFPIGENGKAHTGREGRTEPETQLSTSITTREGGRKENNFVVIGSTQKNAGVMKDMSTCLGEAMGKGGGHVPILVHNMLPCSSKSGKGGTGHLTREDGNVFTLDTGRTNAVEIVEERNNGKLDDRTLESKKRFQGQKGNMSDMQEKEKNGDTPYRQRLAQQQGRKSNGDMQKLPQQAAQKEKGMQGMRKTAKGFGVLRETLSEIQEIRKSNDVQKKSIYASSSIRRLTPLETERLQGLPDNWTKEPNISDTQRYKLCGNGVTVNVVREIISTL